MRVHKTEVVDPYDVDGTLILPYEPGTRQLTVDVYDAVTKGFITVAVHEPMVRLLRESYHRGAHVIVWSRGGYQWAANVVRALGLEECVHDVYSKPMAYFDDTPVDLWLPYRVFLDPKMKYKKPLTKGAK